MDNSFVYGDFLLRMKLDELIGSRFIEATIRGGFGHVFRRITCINKGEDCDNCQFNETCVFRFVFDTQPPANSSRMRKYNKVPRPFTLFVISDTPKAFDVNIKLFGNSVKYLPYFTNSFIALGNIGLGKERTKFELQQVQDLTSGNLLFEEGKHTNNRPLNREFDLNDKNLRGPEKLQIHLETPLSLRKNGSQLIQIDFDSFIMTLMRRIGNIFYFHQGIEADIDYKHIKKLASEVEVIEDETIPVSRSRYSTRQNQKFNMDGILGNFTVFGNLNEIYKYLKLGEVIQVGRGTTFGQGKYKLEVLI